MTQSTTHQVWESAAEWASSGPIAVATVVGISGSTPRQPGSVMVVAADGSVAGSVSSGCVESAVFEMAEDVLATGDPQRRTFGFSDDESFDIGLTCGGQIEVFVQRVDDASSIRVVSERITGGLPTAVATVVEHPDPALVGTRLVVADNALSCRVSGLGDVAERRIQQRMESLLDHGSYGEIRCGLDGSPLGQEVRLFVDVWSPPPRLVIFGAVDFAASLAGAGRFLGYDVTVCDARPTFTTPERFSEAHRVVVDWPHRYLQEQARQGLIDQRTVVCVLTHDARFDVPALKVALGLPNLGYIGAMGSRKTHDDRIDRLRAAGVAERDLARLRSPLGLDLGGVTPEETALSIAAEFVADRRGGSGARLCGQSGPIHDSGTSAHRAASETA